MSEKYIRVSDIGKVSSPSHDYGVPQFTAEEIAKSIGAEPRENGHWITKALSAEQSIDDLPRLISKCSVCGKKLQFVTLATQMPYKFCPNCGSRMDEVEE